MKKYLAFVFLITGAFLSVSCSKDDDTDPSEKSDANQITGLMFEAYKNEALTVDVMATINQDNTAITATLPKNTDMSALNPTIEVSPKATVSPTGAQDFSSNVVYTITAEDGTKATYTVMVQKVLNTGKEVIGFSYLARDNAILNADVIASIDQDQKHISVILPYGTDISALVPTIELSKGAQQTSVGVNPATFTVTAEDGAQAIYTFSVTYMAPSTPREALIAIAVKNPDNTLGWDIYSDDISTWNGVVTDTNGDVIHLNLSRKGLTIVPEEIGLLTRITRLDLSQNILFSIPDEIGKLPELAYLDLSGNQLSSIPDNIGELIKLNSLSIQNNLLTEIPKTIFELPLLTYLDLSGNQLTHILIRIGDQTSLTYLNAGYNQLTSIPKKIGILTGLTHLNVSGNGLTGIPTEIENLLNLTELNLAYNELTSIPEEIGKLTKLMELFIHNNTLSSIPKEIGNLKELSMLIMTHNPLLKSIPSEVCSLATTGTVIVKDDDAVCEGRPVD